MYATRLGFLIGISTIVIQNEVTASVSYDESRQNEHLTTLARDSLEPVDTRLYLY